MLTNQIIMHDGPWLSHVFGWRDGEREGVYGKTKREGSSATQRDRQTDRQTDRDRVSEKEKERKRKRRKKKKKLNVLMSKLCY